MFSVCSFTLKANSAISRNASGANSRRTPSVSSSAEYCLVSEALGSVRMRRKSSTVFRSEGELGHLAQCFGSELEAYAFGLKQRGVLLGERGLGLGENAQEIVYGERLQLNANGEAALQFGDQVAGLGNMECAGGDEEDVVGADHAVARVDGGSFNDGEDIALNAFAGDVGAVATLAAGNLVDFIEEDDAVGFDAVDCGAIDSVHIDEAAFFFLDQVVECVADFHFAFL